MKNETIFEVTLRVNVKHTNAMLDQNSVKSLINQGMSAIADNVGLLSTINDNPADSICVTVIKLKENKRIQDLAQYGTKAVQWGRD